MQIAVRNAYVIRSRFASSLFTIVLLLVLPLLATFGARAQQQEFQTALNQAAAARQKDDMPSYERLLRNASNFGELDEWGLRALSWCIRRQGRPEDAIEIASSNFDLHPCAESCAELGECYADSGDYEAARSYVKRILNAVPAALSNPIVKPLYDKLAIRTYEFKWNVDLAAQRKLQPKGSMILPIPFESRPYQTAKTTATGYPSRLVMQGENRFIQVDGTSGSLMIASTISLIPVSYRKAAKAAGWEFPEATRIYTRKTANVNPEDTTVLGLARELKAPTYYQTVLNIMTWVNANIKVKIDGPAGGSTAEILQRGGGHCEARAASGIAIMRACGIPARFVRGNAFILEKKDISWHTITEYYIPNLGWVTWDYGGPPLQAMGLGFVATFSYGNSFDGPVYGEPETAGAWGFQVQSPTCDFISGKLVSTKLQ